MKTTAAMVVVAAAMVVVAVLNSWPAHAEDSIDCKYVLDHAKACKKYVTGEEDGENYVCCNGLRRLARKAATVDQQKDVCRCSAKIFERLKGVREDRLAMLLSACRAKIPFTLSKKPDCDNIGKS